MTQFDATLDYNDGDIDTNRSGNPHLNELIASRYSRRQTLFGGISAAATAVCGGALLSACGSSDADDAPPVAVGAGANTATTG